MDWSLHRNLYSKVKMEFSVLALDVLHRSEQSFMAAFLAHNKDRVEETLQVHGAGDMQCRDWEQTQLSGCSMPPTENSSSCLY